MRTEYKVNYKINWASTDPKDDEDRKKYFKLLRQFLFDLKNLGKDEIDDLFIKYDVHLIEIDDFPRVNLDEPK